MMNAVQCPSPNQKIGHVGYVACLRHQTSNLNAKGVSQSTRLMLIDKRICYRQQSEDILSMVPGHVFPMPTLLDQQTLSPLNVTQAHHSALEEDPSELEASTGGENDLYQLSRP